LLCFIFSLYSICTYTYKTAILEHNENKTQVSMEELRGKRMAEEGGERK
jgi:hypothetical protein